uniref:GPI mannosyltransferase 2 n=1 Tax=Myxine glutinosa TaxID=7769 RepID=UPI0035902BA1
MLGWSAGDKQVVLFTLQAKIFALLLQVVSNLLIPDHEADAFNPPLSPFALYSPLDRIVLLTFSGLARWDGAYFISIAEHGYVFEQMFAFFPLLPFFLNVIALPLRACLGLSAYSALLVSTAILNTLLSLLATLGLYRLGQHVLKCEVLASHAALLFAITPATVFTIAAYSESLFASLTFWGLLALEQASTIPAAILLGLASAARSNGIANVGFVTYCALRTCMRPGHLCSTLKISLVVLATLLPSLAFQEYGRQLFCNLSPLHDIPDHMITYGQSQGYRIRGVRGDLPLHCNTTLPGIYRHLQEFHWGLGLFKYYELKQIPNFLLAGPSVILAAAATLAFIHVQPTFCLRLGLQRKTKPSKAFVGFFRCSVFIYVAHMAAMLLIGLVFMHVQVLTRFLASSCPAFYWFAAHIGLDKAHSKPTPVGHTDADVGIGAATFLDTRPQASGILKRRGSAKAFALARSKNSLTCVAKSENLNGKLRRILPRNSVVGQLLDWTLLTRTERAVLAYFLGYAFVGVVFHCNFYPWT